jgi:isoleucyl-tRNA synthetase
MEKFDTVVAIDLLKKFVDDFSNWYVRRSRDRVGPTVENIQDKKAFYSTTYKILITFCQLLAPIAPFISEEIYRGLTSEESVHLSDWPLISEISGGQIQLIEQMHLVRQIVEQGLSARKEAGIKVRQPLSKFSILNSQFSIDDKLIQLIKDELNVKEVVFEKGEGLAAFALDTDLTPELVAEGKAREIIRSIQEQRKILGTSLIEMVQVELPEWPEDFEEYIKKQALVATLVKANQFAVKRV